MIPIADRILSVTTRALTAREICAALFGTCYTGRQLWAVLGVVDSLEHGGLLVAWLEQRAGRECVVYLAGEM